MPSQLDLREAQALLAEGNIDIIDVRDPSDWAFGHVPQARNVPLYDIEADPLRTVPRDRVLFVCARGVRSLSAAAAAEDAGRKEIYSLKGGTSAWEAAGLPVERLPDPEAPTRSRSASAGEAGGEAAGDACGIPEPGLDAVVAANVRKLREQRGLSLDALARMTGLSRALLGQIELGRATPSVSVVWRLARAFDVHFSALLGSVERAETSVMRVASAKRLVSPDGRFSSRALYNVSEKTNVEFYEMSLAAHSREDAEPHHPGTRENIVVGKGRVEIIASGERFELAKGDSIVFTADGPHSYVNPGDEECTMYLVITYAVTGA